MIEAVVTDAGFVLAVRWMLAIVFAIAAIHKLSSPAAFVGTLRAYRLFPESLIAVFAWLAIASELFIVAALLLNKVVGALAASVLLFAYASAIGINILRGRRDIDCGCAGPSVRQTLSGWLLVRNAGFIALALLTCISAPEARALTMLDWFTAIAATAAFGLGYTAANQLASIKSRFAR